MDAILVDHLTKRFGPVAAVDDLSFTVAGGRITGFLGPNGAGKTTTLRALLGLQRPTSGQATFAGAPYDSLPAPLRTVGAMLETTTFHPGRRARDHLAVLAAAGGVASARVDEVLGVVGLTESAARRVRGYSLGMRQRLGLAAALLGDPEILVLDEPTNGLDPDGVRWLRDLLRSFADEGRTVLVSSHLLAEVAQTVDHVVVIARGRLVASAPLGEILRLGGAHDRAVIVRTPQADDLLRTLEAMELSATIMADGRIRIEGATPESVGRAMADGNIVVYELQAVDHNLEDVFFELTDRSRGTR